MKGKTEVHGAARKAAREIGKLVDKRDFSSNDDFAVIISCCYDAMVTSAFDVYANIRQLQREDLIGSQLSTDPRHEVRLNTGALERLRKSLKECR